MNIHSPLAPPVKPARFALIVKERVSAVNPVWEKYPLVAMSMEWSRHALLRFSSSLRGVRLIATRRSFSRAAN